MNTTTALDPWAHLDTVTIRANADKLSRASLVAIIASDDIDLGGAGTIPIGNLVRAGVTDRDLAILNAAD